jgi:hypothetical protein
MISRGITGWASMKKLKQFAPNNSTPSDKTFAKVKFSCNSLNLMANLETRVQANGRTEGEDGQINSEA